MSATNKMSSANRSRVTLVLIAALFALPLVVAWVMNFYFQDWRPTATSNYGELVIPVRLVERTGMTAMNGEKLDESFFRDKWTLVYIGAANCPDTCQQNLYKIRQVRLAQGKNIDRIQRLMLVTDTIPDNFEAAKHYPGMVFASPASKNAIQVFDPALESGGTGAERIYLVDPAGNLMMQYPANADPSGMKKDLEKLLKASYIG